MAFKQIRTLSELVDHLTALQRERQDQGLGDLDLFSDSRLDEGVSAGIELEVAEIKRRSSGGGFIGQGTHGKDDDVAGDGDTQEALLMGSHWSW